MTASYLNFSGTRTIFLGSLEFLTFQCLTYNKPALSGLVLRAGRGQLPISMILGFEKPPASPQIPHLLDQPLSGYSVPFVHTVFT